MPGGEHGKKSAGGTFLFWRHLSHKEGKITLAGLNQETSAVGESGAAMFQKSWSIYDSLSEKNYMHHREIYARVEEWLGQQGGEAYSILDLGCGNARFLAPCLKKHPPAMYVGVDLSAAALEEAKEHLGSLLHVALRQEEMVEALKKSKSRFEVIFSGYALHHLDAAKKVKFLTLCLERLAPGAALLLVDVVREEGESREAYIERYLEFMRRDWAEVPGHELAEACAHVQAHDFPETESALRGMGEKAGFARMNRLARFGPHQLWELQTEEKSRMGKG